MLLVFSFRFELVSHSYKLQVYPSHYFADSSDVLIDCLMCGTVEFGYQCLEQPKGVRFEMTPCSYLPITFGKDEYSSWEWAGTRSYDTARLRPAGEVSKAFDRAK